LDCAIILKNDFNQLDNKVQNETKAELSENELSIADWVYKHSAKAGKYTDTLPSTDFTFYPLTGNNDSTGLLPSIIPNRLQGEEQFWEAFLSQISGKYERVYDAARKPIY
jgi:two-component system sensor histidine kinase KdpD